MQMDPTNNNPANGSGSGGESPAGAGVPSNAGTVNPPAANVASQSSSSTFTGAPSVGPRISSTPNMTGTRGTGAFAPGAYRPMSARPMNSGMMPAAQMPIASGTGDIVLSKDTGGSKSKKWWIIGGAIGAVLVVALVVLAIINNGGFGGPKATDLRSAFNIYANYLLIGEAKNEEIVEPELNFEEDLEEENEVEETGNIVENLDDIEEGVDVEDESDSFFIKYIDGRIEDEDVDYLNNLSDYFNRFYNYYVNEMEQYQFATEYVENYKSSLDLAVTYHNGSMLEKDVLYEKFTNGGSDAVEEYINETSSSYDEIIINNNNDESFREVLIEYGEAELRQFEWYQEVGCLKDGEIDYDCVEGKEDERSLVIEDSIIKYDTEINEFIEAAVTTVNNGVFRLKSILNEDAAEFYTDDEYVRENDKDEGEVEEDEE